MVIMPPRSWSHEARAHVPSSTEAAQLSAVRAFTAAVGAMVGAILVGASVGVEVVGVSVRVV